MKKIVFMALLITAFFEIGAAQAAEWKFIGGTVLLQGEKTIDFFDTKNVEHIAGGKIKVWVKGITHSAFEAFLKKEEIKIAENSSKKLAAGYVPPYFLLNPQMLFEQAIGIITWEEAANLDQAEPRFKIFYEINCAEKKIRALSAVSSKSAVDPAATPELNAWTAIIPDSNGDVIQKILCKEKE